MFENHTAGEFASEVAWTVGIVVVAGIVYYGGKSVAKRVFRRGKTA